MTSAVPAGRRVASQLAVSPLHAAPTRPSEQVSEVLCGEILIPLETRDEGGEPWLLGEGADGYRGWLPVAETSPVDESWPGPDPVRVRAWQAEVRDGHSGDTVRRVLHGAQLRRQHRDAGRLFVELPGGASGWMDAAAEVPFYAPRPTGTIGETFEALTRALLGIPYRWGGRSVSGLDCSGLVQLVLAELGVLVPRDASLQEAFLASRVTAVGRDDLSPLDVLFWGSGTKAGHTGLAVDRHRFLHARRWVRIGAFTGGPDMDLAASFRGAYRAAELLVAK